MACGDATALAKLGTGGADAEFMAALREARKEVEAACGGAIDLHPKGIVSRRYGYDGSAAAH